MFHTEQLESRNGAVKIYLEANCGLWLILKWKSLQNVFGKFRQPSFSVVASVCISAAFPLFSTPIFFPSPVTDKDSK